MTFIKHKKQIKCGMWLSWKPDESFVKKKSKFSNLIWEDFNLLFTLLKWPLLLLLCWDGENFINSEIINNYYYSHK